MTIKRVAVIGMGTMGSQIGVVCAKGGYETTMAETSTDVAEKGLRNIKSFLKNQLKKGKINTESHDQILSRIHTTAQLNHAVSQSDLVIEAVYEDIEVKKKLFKEMDAACSPKTVFASNTSTLWIAELSGATKRPDKCIGTHFLIPAALTPLVEVVRGPDTSDATHNAVIDFLKSCGKETVTVADSPGFVINRLYLPMVNEAFFCP